MDGTTDKCTRLVVHVWNLQWEINFSYSWSIGQGKIIFVQDKIRIVLDQIFFVWSKKLCPRTKSSSLLVNWMKNDILRPEKIFVLDKSYFVHVNFDLIPDKNNFVLGIWKWRGVLIYHLLWIATKFTFKRLFFFINWNEILFIISFMDWNDIFIQCPFLKTAIATRFTFEWILFFMKYLVIITYL